MRSCFGGVSRARVLRRLTEASTEGGAPGQVARNVGGVMAATVAGSVCVFLVAAQGVQLQRSLLFGPAALGEAISVYYVGATLGSVPLGRLAERVGGARVLGIGAFCSGVLLELFAVVAASWLVVAILLFMAGIVSSGVQPAANAVLARRTPASRQGLAFGLKQAAVPLAAVAGGVAVPLIAIELGWRWSFCFAGIGAFAAAWVAPRSGAALATRRLHARVVLPKGSARVLVVLAIALGLGVFASTGLTAFVVTSAVHSKVAKGDAGWLAALGGMIAVVSRVASGWGADRKNRDILLQASSMLAGGAVGYGMLAVGTVSEAVPVLICGVVIGFGAGWGWNGLFQYAVTRAYPDAPARATSVTSVGARLAGAVGPVTFGVIASRTSYSDAWLVDCMAALAGSVTLFAVSRLLRRSASIPGPTGEDGRG